MIALAFKERVFQEPRTVKSIPVLRVLEQLFYTSGAMGLPIWEAKGSMRRSCNAVIVYLYLAL